LQVCQLLMSDHLSSLEKMTQQNLACVEEIAYPGNPKLDISVA